MLGNDAKGNSLSLLQKINVGFLVPFLIASTSSSFFGTQILQSFLNDSDIRVDYFSSDQIQEYMLDESE